MVELPAFNRKAVGSSPATFTRKLQRRRWLHRHLIALGAGSNPAGLSPRDCGAIGRRGEKTTSVVIRSFSQKQDKNVT